MDPPLVSASQARTENGSSTPDVERRSANFSPSVWGEYFLKYASMETSDIEADKRIQELKEEVKRVLSSSPPSQRLDLIDYIQRLGVSHHFEDEIHQLLQQIHNQHSSSCDDDDLHTVALRFRLLRQEGFKVSCDMFNNFIDVDGKLKESCVADVAGLLSLYETAHLRTHGEEFLDQAMLFITTQLELAVATQGRLTPPLSNQVAHALYQPLWKGNPRIEARHYLSSYQELNSAPHFSQSLLTFAKLDFNHYQRIHQKELSEITRWWKELDFVNKLPFARNRIVEAYFWSLGVCFEPKNRFPRETFCKFLGLLTMVDDTFDTHGYLDELELFTEAIQRWDLSAMDPLPAYMKIIYQAILNAYTEAETELAKEGNSYRIVYLIETMQCQVRAYLEEAKWYHLKDTPKTYDEYMRVALITSGMFMVEAAITVPLSGEISTRDSLESLFRNPNNKMVNASNTLGRLLNDIRSRQYEQKRGVDISSIECYMKEHCVTEEEALIEINKQVNDAWKDVNEELLQPPPTVPREILLMCLNLLRVTDVIYKHDDGYTNAGVVLKDYITSLLVEPAPI